MAPTHSSATVLPLDSGLADRTIERVALKYREVTMARGKVKYFDSHEGYGYIVPEDEPTESLFVSVDELEDDEPLVPGQYVEYQLAPSGSAAHSVRGSHVAHASSTVTA